MSDLSHLTANQRAAIARGREVHSTHVADQEAAAEQNRRNAMTRRKTPVGDSVDKFPKLDGLRDQVADVMEALSDAYDETEKAKAFSLKLDKTTKTDPARFPAIGGGQ